MKKKIKELTVAEAKKICNKYEDCADGCPLHKFSCLDIMYLTKSEMEEEIEVDDDN